MINYQRIFRDKIFRILVSIMAIIALFVSIYVDFKYINEFVGWENVLIAKPAAFYDWPWTGDGWLSFLAVILSIFTSIISLIVLLKLRKSDKNKDEISELRKMLRSSIFYFTIARFLEGIYLCFDTDFLTIREVLMQFYITLDVLTMIILVTMSFLIFSNEDLLRRPLISVLFFIISVSCAIFGFLMMLFYGINSEAFASSIVIAFGLFAILAIVAALLAVSILRVVKKIHKNKLAVIIIAIQLILIVVSVFLLIGVGLTVDQLHIGNYLPNRVLRVIRVLILLICAFFYYHAYINPKK